MKSIGFGASRRVCVTVLMLVVFAVAAALAVPMVTSANDAAEGERDGFGPGRGLRFGRSTVADCTERAESGEFPVAAEFLKSLVTDGVISQEQADEIARRAREEFEYRCVARVLFQKREAVTATAEVTDSSLRDVVRALRDGESLASFAQKADVTQDDLVSAIMGDPERRAAEAVAAGEISQEETDDALALVREYVAELIHAKGIGGLREVRW